jgi:hypothetical protein
MRSVAPAVARDAEELAPHQAGPPVLDRAARGGAFEDAAYEGAKSAQRAIAGQLGARRFAQLRDALQEVSASSTAGELESRPRSGQSH